MVEPAQQGESLGGYMPAVAAALSELAQGNIIPRIWQGDHRVWRDDPAEIADRLGWLTAADTMQAALPGLREFAAAVQAEGCRHVVLLGMGGSSLGPETLRHTFGFRDGCPELAVLDSTLPAWIEAIDQRIDPARTLFLVSSKSGATIEPNALYAYFRQRTAAAVGADRAGQRFAAVTDPGTVLERLGREQGFRRIFLNPPDIGGRYSALSCFGLAPAALLGLDVGRLLARAAAAQEQCAVASPHNNPGARLGAIMGGLARRGRDKLTLVTSPALAGFGLWAEQLLAESLGKQGTGIVPVAGEPLLPPDEYGPDRQFIYLRLADDADAAADAVMTALAGKHPVMRLELTDRYDLGAEFYRWEFAVAIAGHLLGVHPFDQPDVQKAKDMTDWALEQYQAEGRLPALETDGSLPTLLAQAGAGDYLAILAYLPDTPAVASGLAALRRACARKYGIAVTAGFGPRYLHSTGQLHKGGPASGRFLQLTADHHRDIPIPGCPYSFGTLADAQAAGDLFALRQRQRRALRLHLGADPAAALELLAEQI